MRSEDCRRVEDSRVHALLRSGDADERADVSSVRAQRQPDDGLSCRVAARGLEIEDVTDDARVGLCPCRFEPRRGERRLGRLVGVPDGELTSGAEFVPDHELARLHGQHLGERRGTERCDVPGISKAAEVHEQTCQGSEIESPARSELVGERGERTRQWSERFGRSLRERSLGFDVENADDRAFAPQRNRELGEDARQGCDVVRIRGDVRRELRTTRAGSTDP